MKEVAGQQKREKQRQRQKQQTVLSPTPAPLGSGKEIGMDHKVSKRTPGDRLAISDAR
jgi:hypothetical protein